MIFDGRLAEDFKLSSGTWVSVGPLRIKVVAHFSPLVRDVVLAGIDRDEVGILVFPDLEACRALCGNLRADATAANILATDTVRAAFQQRLESLAAASTGSSTCVARALLLEEPPSLDGGEVTDKGSLNQRAVLERRANLVEELYAAEDSDRIIRIHQKCVPRKEATSPSSAQC
jgi:feruloyl-CoA synthase